MSRITDAFAAAHAAGRAAFIPYLTGGYPDREAFQECLLAVDASGADIIEVGLPFSDPLADGPTIQASSQAALEAGATPEGLLTQLAGLKERLRAALVIMTYYNPVEYMGLAKFAQLARVAGAAGVIIPDLPPEEACQWRQAASAAGLDTIFMAAPTTTDERLEAVAEATRGFMYLVSLTGVTGSGLNLGPEVLAAIARAKGRATVPVAVGFGVSGPDHARMLAPAADGVIVGSALVKAISQAEPAGRAQAAGDFCAGLMAALGR